MSTSTGTEVDIRRPQQPISARLQYARALADSGLLPAAYRKNPANVLWAAEYGDMLGLSTMAAITGVHVIDGKPTASAGLISALVRQAGHRLRVTGNDKQAIAEITRADDTRFTFRSEWTIERARQAELLGKGNWKKYPAAMLKARAITEVARDACEEALFGLHYTPEELGAEVDEDGVVIGQVVGDTESAPVRIEYGQGGTITVDPDCLADGDGGSRQPQRQPAAGGNGNGKTLFQQLLTEAARFRTDAAGARIESRAKAAAKKNEITIEQELRIQDRIQRTRASLYENAEPVDVEDLARQAAAGEPEPEPADDTLPVEDPPEDWPQAVKPGTGTPKGK